MGALQMMRSVLVFLVALSLTSSFRAAAGADTAQTSGDTTAAEHVRSEWERKFREIPSPDNMREYMKRLSAHPHHVGSPYDKDNAEWILSQFKDWGLDAHIETFDVLFPTPKVRVLELLEPTKFLAKLQEPAVSVDPTSDQQGEQLPSYNAYSRDGDVTGRLVYVNYGLPQDYEKLERLGVSVKGAIVIARYGESWRGIKPKVAAEHGAIGCLIYSDPQQDGYFYGDTFPKGPMRSQDGVQRGSVMDMPLYPGDPLTPDVGATPDAKRLALKDAPTITKIPVLPISYGDAQPLLAALNGPMAPLEWRGGLPIPYHLGPGPAKVHLNVQFNWDIKKIYDVIAKIPGTSEPDEWVIRGNHHDAWVNGAMDPVSGQAALLEEARALSELMKQGWRPRRTIIYCAWDGEDPGLLGSTEWAEAHSSELRQHAAVYINTDDYSRGYVSMNGSHSLEHFINGVVHEIQDPETKLSVWKRLQLEEISTAKSQDERNELRRRADLRIAALGAGTDFTVFIDHLGIATLDLSYGGEDDSGVYHSIYDDFYWFTHFADTNFVYGRALAQTVGTAVMRLSDEAILPYEFTGFADAVRNYLKEIKTLLSNQQDEIQERDKELEEGVFQATSDPRCPTVAPRPEEYPPYLNFAPLENAVDALTKSAERYQKALAEVPASTLDSGAPFRSLNQKLIQSERLLTDVNGQPGRPWFRHLIYAPGAYTGYSAKTIPGVREAIEQRRYPQAEVEIERVAKALEDEAALINSAASELAQLPAERPSR